MLYIQKFVFWFACVNVVLASTLEKRQQSSLQPKDVEVLNFALTLEHLEDAFYRQGLDNFTQRDFKRAGYRTSVYKNLKAVSVDEAKHIGYLTRAIKSAGGKPVKPCTYNFGTASVQSFLATASILEGVGVSAYLGAVQYLNQTSNIVDAGSILSVEARHSAYLRLAGLKQEPFPYAYDTPLDFNAVWTLAYPFIESCPGKQSTRPPMKRLKTFTKLTVDTSATIKHKATSKIAINTNDTITLAMTDMRLEARCKGTPLYAAWMCGPTKPIIVRAHPAKDGRHFTAKVPDKIMGQTYVFLTACNDTLTDKTTLAGPAIVEVGD